MKVRTETEMQEFLDEEFAWRRKELSAVWADLKLATGLSRNALLRAGTALLYAHWEGFVKVSSEAYVEYVARRRLRYKELSPGFLALALRNKLNVLTATDDISAHIAFVDFVSTGLQGHALLPKLGAISTGGNLNSKRLKRIVLSLGLDYSSFELKQNLIDNQLLHWRNTIAHGRLFCPKMEDYGLLYEETAILLRNFKDQISNAITLAAYRRTN